MSEQARYHFTWTMVSFAAAILAALSIFTFDFSFYTLPLILVQNLYLYVILLGAPAAGVLIFLRSREVDDSEKGFGFRIGVRYTLGFLWFLDGLLQIQPQMPFGFSYSVLEPSLSGLPGVMSYAFKSILPLWSSHWIMMDSTSAVIQMFIGAGFLTLSSRRNTRIIAGLSLVWGIAIWVIGEGAGGIFSSGASLVSGFPGAALLYAIPSALLLTEKSDMSIARSIRIMLAALLSVGSILQLLPGNGFWAAGSIRSLVALNSANVQPGAMFHLITFVSMLIPEHADIINIALAALLAATAVLWLKKPGVAAWATVILFVPIWLFGQDMGVFGMYGTDPNTALPVILLSIVAVPHAWIRVKHTRQESMRNIPDMMDRAMQ